MILDLQRRIAEVGRIRIGQQVATSNGKSKRPAKLTTFRLTSADRIRIQQAAMLYGGELNEWEAPAGKQWEVVTEADALNVIVPPSDMAFSQHYELWSGGGCQRRCDGQFETIGDQPCVCDPDKRECKIHTRLSVMLRDLPGLGVWRVDTQGYYAAVELQGAVEVVQLAAGAGQMLPAKLRLEQRMIKRANQGVKRFAVPVLDIEVSPAQLLGGGAGLAMLGDGTPGTIAIEAPRSPVTDGSARMQEPPPAFTPVPPSVPEAPTAPVAEQATATRERKPRKNAAQPVPRTGIRPRTAAQAAASHSGAKPEPSQAEEAGSVPDGPATSSQNKAINALFIDADCKDRDSKRHVIVSILGYAVQALTEAEAEKIIHRLSAWKAAGELTEKVWEIVDPPEPDRTAAAPQDHPPAPDESEPVDAEIVPDADADGEGITDPQKTKLAIVREERYAKTIKGRGEWFAWVNAQLQRSDGQHVSSNTELTKHEAMKLLDLLDIDNESADITTE